MSSEVDDRERYARLAKAQAAVSTKQASGMIPPLWMVVAAALFVGALAYVTGWLKFDDGARAQYVAARSLWLADCKKPIEVCASDWQFNYELRDIYAAKVPLKS